MVCSEELHCRVFILKWKDKDKQNIILTATYSSTDNIFGTILTTVQPFQQGAVCSFLYPLLKRQTSVVKTSQALSSMAVITLCYFSYLCEHPKLYRAIFSVQIHESCTLLLGYINYKKSTSKEPSYYMTA